MALSGNDETPWGAAEDIFLQQCVQQEQQEYDQQNRINSMNWFAVAWHFNNANAFPVRSNQDCRERYQILCREEQKLTEWTQEQELTMLRLTHILRHLRVGRLWITISRAACLNGRSPAAIKGHYRIMERRKRNPYSSDMYEWTLEQCRAAYPELLEYLATPPPAILRRRRQRREVFVSSYDESEECCANSTASSSSVDADSNNSDTDSSYLAYLQKLQTTTTTTQRPLAATTTKETTRKKVAFALPKENPAFRQGFGYVDVRLAHEFFQGSDRVVQTTNMVSPTIEEEGDVYDEDAWFGWYYAQQQKQRSRTTAVARKRSFTQTTTLDTTYDLNVHC